MIAAFRLNSFWQGADWNLAERYTDILKTIFVGLFFAVPVPSGLFITAFAMLSTYLVDKYSLFRIWKRSPMIGSSLGTLSRYFYILIVFAHLSISRIFFANWPYRGLWNEDSADKAQCTFFECKINRYINLHLSIMNLYYNNNNMLFSNMTEDQKEVVKTYSSAVIIMFAVVLAWIIFFKIANKIKKFFFGKVDAVGEASQIYFRYTTLHNYESIYML
jgi:hypothetical protein